MTAQRTRLYPLRHILLRAAGWACVAVLLLAALARAGWGIIEADRQLESTRLRIEQDYLPQVANSLEPLDQRLLEQQLATIARLAGVTRVRLLRLGHPPLEAVGGEVGGEPASSWDYPIGDGEGSLIVQADLRALPDNPLHILLDSLLYQALLVITLLTMLAWVLRQHLALPIRSLVAYASALDASQLDQPVVVPDRAGFRSQELAQLHDALTALCEALAREQIQQHAARAQLETEQGRLHREVAQQTARLNHLIAFQRLVGELSTEFMRVPQHRISSRLDEALGRIGEFLGVQRVSLFEYDPELVHFRYTREWVAEGFASTIDDLDEINARDYPWWAPRIMSGPVVIEDVSKLPPEAIAERSVLSAHGVHGIVGVPMRSSEGVTGFVTFDVLDKPREWSEEQLTLLQLAAELLGSVLVHQHRHEELQAAHARLQESNRRLDQQSRQDGLTGLSNRRHFDEVRQTEYKRARRDNLPLSLLLCDLDGFKRYNDALGHAAGDDALRAFAACMTSVFLRDTDLVARTGGEEFCVLLPNTPQTSAATKAEELRAAVWARNLVHPQALVADRLTVSIGVATLDPAQDLDADALYRAADGALYEAKHQGRNRVEIAHRPSEA